MSTYDAGSGHQLDVDVKDIDKAVQETAMDAESHHSDVQLAHYCRGQRKSKQGNRVVTPVAPASQCEWAEEGSHG